MGKRILMALMGLDIGGAETHVLELAEELTKRGWEVTVASNGGVFQEELEKAGVRHLWAPLQNKNPFNILKSRRILKKDIKANNYDVVHGHARIPSAILGSLQKKMKFPFITTAHWVFKANFPYNFITNWGDRCVAVSDDIKQYLIDNYEYPAREIAVTINGINTDKFSGDADYSDILKEFPIDKKKKQICSVSRMDTDRSAVAFHLIEAMLRMKRDDIQAVIVGGGNDFDRLKAEVEKANEVLGENTIIATGERTDINKFIANCDIFVNVSRAVLEAMAASKQVICAGNEGYIGIVSDRTYSLAQETNFCCRGCEMATTDLILKDLEKLLSKEIPGQARNDDKNRERIIADYSVSRMVDDYEREYAKLNAKKVIFSGYYGYHNMGDDCLLGAILDNLENISDMPIRATVLSAKPDETRKIYGVASIKRYNVFKVWKLMKKSDLLIMGGGSILQDVTSTKSLFYYISIMKMAKRAGCKLMLYANGFGPINKEKNRLRAKDILEKADVITVREKDSLEYAKELGLENENIYVTADPAFMLEGAPSERIDRILQENNIDGDFFCVSVRPWEAEGKDFICNMVSVTVNIQEKYKLTPVFIMMQASRDARITRDVCGRVAGAKILEIYDGTDDVIGVLKAAKFMIGMRLHSIIYAAVANCPFVAISYDPKVRAVAESLGMDKFIIDVEDFEVDRVLKCVKEIEGQKEKLAEKVEEAKRETLRDAACVKRVLS